VILLRPSGLGEFVTVTDNGLSAWNCPNCWGVGANRFQRYFVGAISLPRTRTKVSKQFAKGRAHGPEDAHALAPLRCRPYSRVDRNNTNTNF